MASAAAIPTFQALVGQAKAKRLLQRALASGRLAHAYLFQGPEGVGKRTSALALAARLNCRDPQGLDGCGSCASCRKLAGGNHPDLLVLGVDPDTIRPQQPVVGTEPVTIKIDLVRQLKKELAFPPFDGGWRVVVVANCQGLTSEAANSLLKTLEEPPAQTIFLLTHVEGQPLLATIRSRCQVVPFAPLSQEEMAAVLHRDHGLTAEEIHELAALAAGGVGRVLRWRNCGLPPLLTEVTTVLETAGADDPATVPLLTGLAARAAGDRQTADDFLEMLGLWLHRQLMAAAQANHPDLARRQQQLTRLHLARRQLRHNCQPRPVCESLFFALL